MPYSSRRWRSGRGRAYLPASVRIPASKGKIFPVGLISGYVLAVETGWGKSGTCSKTRLGWPKNNLHAAHRHANPSHSHRWYHPHRPFLPSCGAKGTCDRGGGNRGRQNIVSKFPKTPGGTGSRVPFFTVQTCRHLSNLGAPRLVPLR